MITERNGNKVTLYANDSIRRASQNNNVLKSYLTANFSALTATEQIKILFFNEERILILDSTGTTKRPSSYPYSTYAIP
jgi:competence protein ComEC